MKTRFFLQISLLLILSIVLVYLFVEAPAPLTNKEDNSTDKAYSIEEAFTLLAQENADARTLYTKAIVGVGKAKGLKYSEDWKEDSVEAGPLPALFLRYTAMSIEKTGAGLGLYLGSDFPISQANLFKGIQAQMFAQIKKDRKPKFFLDEATQRYTAMFADIAGAEACVSCHNEHKKSPKKDWKLNDVMGATTWSFAKDSISAQEMLKLLKIYRASVSSTYETYVNKTQKFAKPPIIVDKFGQKDYDLPSVKAFIDSLNKISSPKTLNKLIHK